MSRAEPLALLAVRELVDAALAQRVRRPLVLGICGAQGSGKSTLAAALVEQLHASGITCAVLSLDDLYLTRAERAKLARDVHPLMATRGPPGTHDVALGMEVLDALRRGTPVRLPRFDKAHDDRVDPSAWPLAAQPCDVVIFEGWCVGARPQPPHALAAPVNDLEAREDPDCVWRKFVNDALAGPYQELFARIDRLVLLLAPDFDVVMQWRLEQEEDLRARAVGGPHVMNSKQIDHFISHYERITRHIFAEMPDRADLVIPLDRERRPTGKLEPPGNGA